MAGKQEKRRTSKPIVFTVEPFQSLEAQWAGSGDGDWTFYSEPRAVTLQYEHTVVVTRNGSLVVTSRS